MTRNFQPELARSARHSTLGHFVLHFVPHSVDDRQWSPLIGESRTPRSLTLVFGLVQGGIFCPAAPSEMRTLPLSRPHRLRDSLNLSARGAHLAQLRVPHFQGVRGSLRVLTIHPPSSINQIAKWRLVGLRLNQSGSYLIVVRDDIANEAFDYALSLTKLGQR